MRLKLSQPAQQQSKRPYQHLLAHGMRTIASLPPLSLCWFAVLCWCCVSGCAVLSGCGWTPSNDLYVSSDDRVIRRYALNGDVLGDVSSCDYYVTSLVWLHSLKGGVLAADVMAVGCSDGCVRLVAASGRVERVVSAHIGSVLCVAWSVDGSSLLTGGEDGSVKQFSRNGNLRSKLATQPHPITAVCWAPDQQRFAYTYSNKVSIQALQANSASGSSSGAALAGQSASSSAGVQSWSAHSSAVLCCDWHSINGCLLSGGEDGSYRVWSEYGDLLYSSRPVEFAVSAVRWSPSGRYFAVGSFNLLCLCDRTGWTYSRHRCSAGSLLAIDWTSDGTHLAAAGSNGTLVLAQLVERSTEWQQYACRLTERNTITVHDLSVAEGSNGGVSGADAIRMEELDFASPVIEWSFSHSHLVVTTVRSCHVFQAPLFAAGSVLELKAGVALIVQSDAMFALIDPLAGITVYSYDGRLINSIRLPTGVSVSSLQSEHVQMAGDTLFLVQRQHSGAGSLIHAIDVTTGKKATEPIRHSNEILTLAVSQCGSAADRQLAFIDRQHELYVCRAHEAAAAAPGGGATAVSSPVKLTGSVSDACWNEGHDVLAAVEDGHVRVYFLPQAPLIDPDALQPSTLTIDVPASTTAAAAFQQSANGGGHSHSPLGAHASIASFSSSRLTLRSSDGTIVAVHCPPVPLLLQQLCVAGEWSRALRVCRVLADGSDRLCWSTLYGLAVAAGQLDEALQSAAQLDWGDKARALSHMIAIPSEAGRSGALAAYQRRFAEAERIYLNGQLPLRAIQLNCDRFLFGRALAIANKTAKQHIHTVIAARRKYLQRSGQEENSAEFVALRDIQVDEKSVASSIAADRKKEESRQQSYNSKLRSQTAHIADAFVLGSSDEQQPSRWKREEEEKQSDTSSARTQETSRTRDDAEHHQQQQHEHIEL